MGSFIDLHVHSNASDGSCSPAELVAKACDLGLSAFALTDHDTVEGIEAALYYAQGTPVKVIPGVEISSVFNGQEVHILGLFIDYTNPFLSQTLASLASMRYDRNSKICEMLCKEGVEITMPMLYARYNSRAMTRANIADLMVEKGYVKSKEEAYEKYIGANAPCFIPKFKLSLEDTAKLLSFSGGVMSIAHPVQYKMTDKEYYEFFRYAKSLGIGGVEAIYSDNSFDDELKFRDLAASLKMFITGGSDFHGAIRPEIDMGTGKGNLMIPSSLLSQIPYKNRGRIR